MSKRSQAQDLERLKMEFDAIQKSISNIRAVLRKKRRRWRSLENTQMQQRPTWSVLIGNQTLWNKEFTISQYVKSLEAEIKKLYKREKSALVILSDEVPKDKLSGRNINRLGNGKY